MGITLALQILEGTRSGGNHGGQSEAVDELIRESFWMTADELTRARRWATVNRSTLLYVAIDAEPRRRAEGGAIGIRVN